MSAQLKFKVGDKAPHGLFIRTAPVPQNGTKKALLPMGQLVVRKSISDVTPWWEVSTTLQSTALDGFVNSDFLVPEGSFTPPVEHSSLSPVHLRSALSVTRSGTARANPLNETNQPTRDAMATSADKVKALGKIIQWLDVENKKRYKPTGSSTFCNVYSYDYCFLADAYLPRVWWMPNALAKILSGTPQSPIYAQTVEELTANRIFNWLKEFGPKFGWRRTFDLTELQNAANDGQVGIICAQRVDLHKPGHICPVVPETSTLKAGRSASSVVKPLQTNAGRTNWKYVARIWWNQSQFREFGFWIHA
ncbi:MAG TPA: hypothetical protein VJ656_01030 [Pyrinomonadaceae bacterium]|nr:hypothetical protein [Pyrinomonadaceae bacterium]